MSAQDKAAAGDTGSKDKTTSSPAVLPANAAPPPAALSSAAGPGSQELSAGSGGTTASKNKKKKKKKNKGSVSSSGATTPNALEALTSVEPSSTAGDTQAPHVPSEDQIQARVPQGRQPPLADSLPRARDADELPNFGDHSTGSVPPPMMGVPAPMPPHGAGLFADDAEQVAFLDDTSSRDDVTLPTRGDEMANVAAFTARTAPAASDLPPAPDADELPNFGDHVEHGHVVEPKMGVPAPMPQHGAALFADAGEQDAFLDSTDPRDGVFTEVQPKVVQKAEAAEAARDALAAATVPSGDKLPSGFTTFDDDEAEEAAFESDVDVDQAVTKAGDEHSAATTKEWDPASSPAGESLPSGVSTYLVDDAQEGAFESEVDIDQAVSSAGQAHDAAAFKARSVQAPDADTAASGTTSSVKGHADPQAKPAELSREFQRPHQR